MKGLLRSLRRASGSGTGVAAAYVRFLGNGTIVSSKNVASVTDHGSGKYTINLTPGVFGDASYTVVFGSLQPPTGQGFICEDGDTIVRTAIALRVSSWHHSGSAQAPVHLSAAFYA